MGQQLFEGETPLQPLLDIAQMDTGLRIAKLTYSLSACTTRGNRLIGTPDDDQIANPTPSGNHHRSDCLLFGARTGRISGIFDIAPDMDTPRFVRKRRSDTEPTVRSIRVCVSLRRRIYERFECLFHANSLEVFYPK
jgi:hypothetical protein